MSENGESVELAKMPTVDQELMLSASRGRAIAKYAQLEQSICHLFATVGGMPDKVASIIYFKVNSADSRAKMIEKMLRLKHGTDYRIFTNSFLKDVREIDKKRNEITHWNVINSIGTGPDTANKTLPRISLMPPSFWVFLDEENGSDSPEVTTEDLIYFGKQCDFYSRLCNMFVMFIAPQFAKMFVGEAREPWIKVFQQPVTYPPLPDHPLFPI